MELPNNVVDVPAMSVGEVNPASADFCQCKTAPVLPLKVRFSGELPEQIVCAEATAPPTDGGLTVNAPDIALVAAPQAPLAMQ